MEEEGEHGQGQELHLEQSLRSAKSQKRRLYQRRPRRCGQKGGRKRESFQGSCLPSKVWTKACPVDLVTQFKLFFEKNAKNVFSLWKHCDRNMLRTTGKFEEEKAFAF